VFKNQTIDSQAQRDLVNLRVSLARLAQIANVETDELSVLGKPYEVLYKMACDNRRGWHRLIVRISDAIEPINVTKKAEPTNVPDRTNRPNSF